MTRPTIDPPSAERMAAALLHHAAEGRVHVRSAGSLPADQIITMGCDETCPVLPGKRYEDRDLDDPAGQGIDAVRPIRDDIRDRVQTLLCDLPPAPR